MKKSIKFLFFILFFLSVVALHQYVNTLYQ